MSKLREYVRVTNDLKDLCASKGLTGLYLMIPNRIEPAKAMYAALEGADKDTYIKYKYFDLRELHAKPIDLLEVTVRASNRLKDAKIKSIGDLVDLREEELLDIPGIGIFSYYEIIIQMFLLGYVYVGNKFLRNA